VRDLVSNPRSHLLSLPRCTKWSSSLGPEVTVTNVGTATLGRSLTPML
jgi:hypothetical protein